MTNLSIDQSLRIPLELEAVLTIFNADSELRQKALPYVDIARQHIDWEGLSYNHFGSGHTAAISWAKAIWYDQTPHNRDLFGQAFSMDGWLRQAVLKALEIRWGMR